MSSEPIREHAFGTDALLSVSKLVADHMRRSIMCCPNCEHFKPEPMLKCGLNNMQPPSTVIAFGCELFVNNDCPF